MNKKEIVIDAQIEIIRAYYNRIAFDESLTRDNILDMLESDMEFLGKESSLLEGEKILYK